MPYAYNTCPWCDDPTPLMFDQQRVHHGRTHHTKPTDPRVEFRASETKLTGGAKGVVQQGMIDNVEFVSKKPRRHTPESLVFNEMSGYAMIQKKLRAAGLQAMIPETLLAQNDGTVVFIQSIGAIDLYDWMTAMRKDPSKLRLIRTSVHFIIGRFEQFLQATNCGSDEQVFHCDLHPANIRLTTAGLHQVTEVHMIDFDMARKDSCGFEAGGIVWPIVTDRI